MSALGTAATPEFSRGDRATLFEAFLKTGIDAQDANLIIDQIDARIADIESIVSKLS